MTGTPANPLTDEEKALARDALGLFGTQTASIQNHAIAREGTPDHEIWLRLVERQFARRAPKAWGILDVFVLTRAGADRALEPGESLNPTDFPTIGQD